MNLLFTIIIAVIGSALFYKMKIPAGALIGAIIFSAGFNIFTGFGEFPQAMKTLVQAVAGGFIGQRVSRQDLTELKSVVGAGILILVSMIAYTFIVGALLAATSKLDLATALVATMPAGLSDIAIISSDLGADATQTTTLALVRTLFSIMILTQMAFKATNLIESHDERENVMPDKSRILNFKPPEIRTLKNTLITLAIAGLSGVLGRLSGVPAGAMSFAVIAIAFQNVKTNRAYLPKGLKLVAQCMTGIIVGIKVTMSDVQNMKFLIWPMLFLIVSLVMCNYICAFFLHKIGKLDVSTSLFASIPAGVSDMALIATDMGGDAPKVGVLQLVRYIGILSVVPTIIKLIT